MSDFEILQTEETTATKPKKEKVRYEQYADAFLMDMAKEEGLRLCYHGGRFLRYDGCRYVPEQQMQHRVRSYLLKKKIPQNNAVVGNVVPIIETRTLVRLDQHAELPFWLTNRAAVRGQERRGVPQRVDRHREGDTRRGGRDAAHAQVGQPPMSPS